ncbi:hypothetical protein [Paenibacillus graminis]|uniref:hypothetical protein n=1 Tax=Paenibacillus graminis TaxID=189425 RepID=UPI002DBCD698|nr:hypothetical protein [Paenibacillus graminis]MEC0167695.1 hypothetical protein [Paenibacillus graminis]
MTHGCSSVLMMPAVAAGSHSESTDNVQRVMISGVHIHDDMDLLAAKIDDNNGIDNTFRYRQ